MSNESHCLHIRQGSRVAALCLAVALSGCIASTRNPDRLIPVAAEMDFLAVDQSRLIANYDRAMASADFVGARTIRSEEHTSELQSRFDLVCRLLLEKKKKKRENLTR